LVVLTAPDDQRWPFCCANHTLTSEVTKSRWSINPFHLGGGPLQGGPDLVGLDLGDRPLLPFGGLPAALAQPPGDHHPVALGKGVGQVLGLPAPDVDPQEGGVAVAPLAVLLDPLGHGDPQVGDGDAGLGEAEFGVVDQVADDGGVVVRSGLDAFHGQVGGLPRCCQCAVDERHPGRG
jgi:hypothetical protein